MMQSTSFMTSLLQLIYTHLHELLNFTKRQNFRPVQIKAVADDKCDQKIDISPFPGNQHFLLSSQCFPPIQKQISIFNPFPNKPLVLRVCSIILLKTLW